MADDSLAKLEETHDERKRRVETEERESEQRSAISATVVHHAILLEGEEELRRPTSALAWSGLAAGLSMGFSLVAEGLLRSHLPDAPWRPLLAKIGYSVGFLVVVLGRQQLFTENTLTAVLPSLHRESKAGPSHVLRLWAVVLAANIVGALAFAWVVGHTAAFEPNVRTAFLEIGQEGLRSSFGAVVLKGIFAGWLIATMVWLLPFAETGRVSVIVIMTYLVGLASLPHIIAGTVETGYVMFQGAVSPGQWFLGWWLPTLIGNTIGGVSLVAALNHAQVVAGKDEA